IVQVSCVREGSPVNLIPAVLATLLISPGEGVPPNAAARDSSDADRAAIERLHQEDKEATLADSADQLAKLWDKDAVRFTPSLKQRTRKLPFVRVGSGHRHRIAEIGQSGPARAARGFCASVESIRRPSRRPSVPNGG